MPPSYLRHPEKAEPKRTSLHIAYLGVIPGIRSEGQAEWEKEEGLYKSAKVRSQSWDLNPTWDLKSGS